MTHAEFGGHSYASHKPDSLLRTLLGIASKAQATIARVCY